MAEQLSAVSLLLTLNDAAQKLGISRRTIERMVYGGQLYSVTIGTRRLVRSADILRIARTGAPSPLAAPAPANRVSR